MQTTAGPVRRRIPQSQQGYLLQALADLPAATRTVLVYDPDGVTRGQEQVADDAGRRWSCLHFWHNVLEMSLRFRERGVDERVLLCVTPGPGQAGGGSLSYLPEFVGALEGTIDLSLGGILRHFEPTAVLPPGTLEKYRRFLGNNLPGTLAAYREIGAAKRGVPLTEADIQAMALHASAPTLAVPTLLSVRTKGLGGLLSLLFSQELEPDVDELLRSWLASSRGDGSGFEAWARADSLDIAYMLYGCAVLRVLGRPVTGFNLRGLGLEPQEVETLLLAFPEAEAWLKADQDLARRVYGYAQKKIPAHLSEQLMNTVGEAVLPVHRAVSELPGDLGQTMFRRRLIEALQRDTLPDWVQQCGERWAPSPVGQEGDLFREMVALLASIESRLSKTLPPAEDLKTLVSAYVGSGAATLEYDLWRVESHANQTRDREVYEAWKKYRPRLRKRIRQRLLELDQALATRIGENVQRFMGSNVAVPYVLRDLLLRPRRVPPHVQRVWVVILDGMRWDLWERVVWPALQPHFEQLATEPYLSLIPSTTKVSRTSLVAGQEPGHWNGVQGTYTEAENALAAGFFGLDRQSWRDQLNFVNRAEDSPDRVWPEISTEDVKPYNLLVYNISDDLIHHEQTDPYSIGRHVAEALRSIIPNLLMLVEEGDTVLVSSDHGFIELDPQDAVNVKLDASFGPQGRTGHAPTDISYRYTRDVKVDEGLQVGFARNRNLGTFYVATGHKWFNRPNGSYTRYAHGGISFSEMAVPGAVLRRRAVNVPSLAWSGVPQNITLLEEEPGVVELVLTCGGRHDIQFTLATDGASIAPASGIARPGQAVKIRLEVSSDYPGGRIRLSGGGMTQAGQSIALAEAEISLVREARHDRVKVDTRAFDLLEGL